MKRKRCFFATANTGSGFVNFLDQIAPEGFIYIVKGGSGTGKSTLMEKVAAHFENSGFSVERFFCSTDTESLDGVRIVEKNIALIDGTAPHVVDVNLVGVTHRIVDTGAFVGVGVLAERVKLEKLVFQKKRAFKRFYEYLVSAQKLMDINFEIEKQTVKIGQVKRKAKNLFGKLSAARAAEGRNLFLKSVNFQGGDLERKNTFRNVVFRGSWSEGVCVLQELARLLGANKIKYDRIWNVLSPDKLDGILLSENILIKNVQSGENKCLKIKNNNKLIKKIICLAKSELKNAKNLHEQIEKIYALHVNFEGIERLTKQVIEEIEAR